MKREKGIIAFGDVAGKERRKAVEKEKSDQYWNEQYTIIANTKVKKVRDVRSAFLELGCPLRYIARRANRKRIMEHNGWKLDNGYWYHSDYEPGDAVIDKRPYRKSMKNHGVLSRDFDPATREAGSSPE